MTDTRTLRIGTIIGSNCIAERVFMHGRIFTGRQQDMWIIAFPRYARSDIRMFIEGYVGNVRTSDIPNVNAGMFWSKFSHDASRC